MVDQIDDEPSLMTSNYPNHQREKSAWFNDDLKKIRKKILKNPKKIFKPSILGCS